MQPRTALKLGRVSNLPTIWTNCMVGFALAGISPGIPLLILIWVALSLFYTAGMFLNDAFDYEWDRLHQQDRPLVNGETSKREVIISGTIMLAIGTGCILLASTKGHLLGSFLSTCALIICILCYNWQHKTWQHSSWLMGGCRLLVYWTVALTASSFSPSFIIPGLCLMGYIAGLTYLAKSEHLNSVTNWWPLLLIAAPLIYAVYLSLDSPALLFLATILGAWLGKSVRMLLPGKMRSVPKAISQLIAGICLIDALILAGMNHYYLAMASVAAFSITLLLQRYIKAT